MKRVMWMLGGLVVLLGIGGFLLHRSIVVSQMEANAPTSASYSVESSKEWGKFIRRVQVSPGHLTYRGDQIAIADAWIERVHDIKYRFLFFWSQSYRDEYRLVVLPGMLPSTDNNFTLYCPESRRYFATQSSGIGKPFVLQYDLGKEYVDTLHCQVVADRDVTDSVITLVLRAPAHHHSYL